MSDLSPIPAETPIADHVERAVSLMKDGARMTLDTIDGNSGLLSAFGGEVSREIARRLPAMENDRLLPDNEDYRKGYYAGYADAYGDAGTLKETMTALKDEVAMLREALMPFAFAKSSLNFDRFDDGNTAWVAVDGAGSDRVYFFVGDVIRARTALTTTEGV
ncbi:hypothetical protein GB928_018325 [Shinella curvata]|uniref:Uncharacterized protein n=1 Tax=Shinella curvata TaxID=1817964 RepID=A0ABT8XHD9_9HYPH|nr:hypothetical protein [Shinella curvata]MCJ8053816.1 hypothetical protein [Shinella curvata]MDO6123148.1 hypothetical protein [Shinella curvata]